MGQMLDDGTCIPSYLGISSRGSSAGSTDMLNDYVLRMGEVKKVIYPNDPLSYGKTTVEYEIEIQYRDGNGIYNTSSYRGCTVSTLFGGIADRFHATFRPDNGSSNNSVGVGSKVITLCLSGDQQKAIILGGVEDPTNSRVESSAAGHNLFFEFNGLRFTVDKDGQATVMFRGATKYDGTLDSGANANAEGTSVTFTKDGSVTVATPNSAQFVKLDHTKKTIEIQADTAWNAIVNGKTSFQSQNDLSILVSSGKVSVGASDRVYINSAGVSVGAATDAWLLGTTYRRSESQMHSQMMSTLSALAAAITTAATSLTIATPLNAIPVVGGVLAAPGLGAAAAALTTAGPLFATLSGYIAAFEATGPTYLSLKNLTD